MRCILKENQFILHKKLAFFLKIGIIRRPCKCTDSHRVYFIEITLEGVEIKINGCVSINMEHWVSNLYFGN